MASTGSVALFERGEHQGRLVRVKQEESGTSLAQCTARYGWGRGKAGKAVRTGQTWPALTVISQDFKEQAGRAGDTPSSERTTPRGSVLEWAWLSVGRFGSWGKRSFYGGVTEQAALEKAAQIWGCIVSTRVGRALADDPDLFQFARRFRLPSRRSVGLRQLLVRLGKAGAQPDGRALPFHGKWICAPGESDSAGEGLDPRIPGREVEGLANGGFRGVFPRRSRVQFAVGQIEIGVGTARAHDNGRFECPPRLFIPLVSMQNDAVRQPDGGPLRPAILDVAQQVLGLVGLPREFQSGGF